MTVLTICIATRNRSQYLDRSLENISRLGEAVEVIVVDGASRDRTAQVLEKYSARIKNFKYLCLSKNGGLDRDYATAVSMASGEFCWLLSDDDRLIPGDLVATLEKLQNSPDVPIIIANAVLRSNDLQKSFKLLFEENIQGHHSLKEFARLFPTLSQPLSYIGLTIFRTSRFKNSFESEAFVGTYFSHFHAVYPNLRSSDNVVILGKPFTDIRSGSPSWAKKSFEIWLKNWPAALSRLDWLEPDQLSECPFYNRKLTLRHALLFKARGDFTVAGFSRNLSAGKTRLNLQFWIIFMTFFVNRDILLQATRLLLSSRFLRTQLSVADETFDEINLLSRSLRNP